MKIFSILKPATFLENHSQEDYFLISKNNTIFVVADGVSLETRRNKKYPEHSGAGEAAKIFCETVMSEAKKRYDKFKTDDLKEIFKIGNEAVLKYNISQKRTKDTINYFDVDLFSATTAFVLIKDEKAYWWSLCDSGVVLFGKWGEQLFCSPEGWSNMKKNLPGNWEKISEKEKSILQHRLYRNKINNKNEMVGYGVADGEEEAIKYLNVGVFELEVNNVLMLYTDGFENYIGLDGFNRIFTSWPDDLKNMLEDMIKIKSDEDSSKYGREKTLIAISVDN